MEDTFDFYEKASAQITSWVPAAATRFFVNFLSFCSYFRYIILQKRQAIPSPTLLVHNLE
jgi:hypothetical protein